MALVEIGDAAHLEAGVEVAIVGAGAAGLVAALAAVEAGVEPLLIERDAVPRGSTALSAGLIPAAGTRWQREHGIDDTAAQFAADIARKAQGLADPALVALVTQASGPAVEWLARAYAALLAGARFSTIRGTPHGACTGCRAGRALSLSTGCAPPSRRAASRSSPARTSPR